MGLMQQSGHGYDSFLFLLKKAVVVVMFYFVCLYGFNIVLLGLGLGYKGCHIATTKQGYI
jgi:hypothetical protein